MVGMLKYTLNKLSEKKRCLPIKANTIRSSRSKEFHLVRTLG